MPPKPPSSLPPGSEQVGAWAKRRGFSYEPRPDPSWFLAWEPYDSMTSPEAYFNAVSWMLPPGTVTLAEPWLAPVDAQPLGRTALVFVQHPTFVRRAAARVGEHFNTRVVYLETAAPPTVILGDRGWDGWAVTLAASPSEAAAAFPRGARELLRSWGFMGHIEVRPGGLVVNFAGLPPLPEHLERIAASVSELVARFRAD